MPDTPPADLSPKEQLLFSTVRIDTTFKDGRKGGGTGFVFSVVAGGTQAPFLVTNKHVVADAVEGSLTFLRRKGVGLTMDRPLKVEVDGFAGGWLPHPSSEVDISVQPLAPLLEDIHAKGQRPTVVAIPESMIPLEDQLQHLDAIEEVTFIGYPNLLADRATGLPIVRRGTTATPLYLPFDGEKRFLIDASVFPGSSGSPVFFLGHGVRPDRHGNAVLGGPSHLLGVLGAVYFRKEEGQIVQRPIPTAAHEPVVLTREMIDLGVVYRSELILDIVRPLLSKAISVSPPSSS